VVAVCKELVNVIYFVIAAAYPDLSNIFFIVLEVGVGAHLYL
jgi:hypothetical protein